MNNDKDQSKQTDQGADDQQQQETLRVKNPFRPGEEKKMDPEQLDKEQEFKEAMTERD